MSLFFETKSNFKHDPRDLHTEEPAQPSLWRSILYPISLFSTGLDWVWTHKKVISLSILIIAGAVLTGRASSYAARPKPFISDAIVRNPSLIIVCNRENLVEVDISSVTDTKQKEFYLKRNELSISYNFLTNPGHHTLQSPIPGTRSSELKMVQRVLKKHPVLEKYEKAIYQPEFIYLIPSEKANEADHAAKELFLQYISKYSADGCTEHNIVDWSDSQFRLGVTYVSDLENEWNTWFVNPVVEVKHERMHFKFNRYLPSHVVAFHELMHVEETSRCKREHYQEPGIELLTATKTTILLDLIYKKIHGLEIDTEVNYGKMVGGKIELGAVANFYRHLETIHGTLALALTSPESIQFLNRYFVSE
jgi:hypothetical protein